MFFYPSSTCRIDIPRLILVPSAHTRSGWGWLKKLESMALSSTEYWMAVRAAFSSHLHFPASPIGTDILDFFSKLFLYRFYLFFRGDFGLAEDWIVLGCIPILCLYLHYSVWAITFLGLGLWALTNKWSWPKILLGPTTAPQKPAVRPFGWRGGFW